MSISSEPNIEVRLIHNPSRVGFTTGKVRESKKSGRIFEVRLAGEGKNWIPESQIELVDENTSSSEDVRNGMFSDPDTLRRLLIHIRLSGRLADMIYSMESTNTEFLAYQFKPVVKIINSPSGGLLIADEVGLGKTIEAGLIWTELKARFDAKNLLILCPKSLTLKWRDELRNKFSIKAEIMDAKQLNSFLNDPSERHESNAIICSRDSIRPDKNWDTDEYDSKRIDQQKLALKLQKLSEGEPIFDLMVVDEAHHLRNPSTQSHMLAELLRSVADHCVFLSATPIHLKNRDLFAQLKLLDPGAFVNEADFEALIEANNPIVEAREAVLHRADSTYAKECVEEALDNNLLQDSESLKKINEDLQKISGDISYEKRAELAARLDTVNLLSNLVTRTRRRDVKELRVERRVKTKKTKMSGAEEEFYQVAEEAVTRYAYDQDINHRFLLATPQRMMTSSMPAALKNWRDKVDVEIDESEDALNEETNDKAVGPLIVYLRDATRSINIDDLIEQDFKYDDLKEFLLQDKASGEKKVIFSSFKPTLAYLKERLEDDGFNPVMIHGGVKNRYDELDKFKSDHDVDILLSSEIGSEGLDLQFCKTLINYDLPWNPMKVEQRIGRVDRFGQQSEYVSVVNFIYDETIDQKIWDRLYDRLQLCQQALGGFEEILGDEIRRLERDILHGGLTIDEKSKRIEQTSIALENKKKVQDELEDEAAGLIAHGDYILNKVQSAHEFNRWLTPNDMIAYLKAVFNEHYPRSKIVIERDDNRPHKITLDMQFREDLSSFITEQKLGGINRALLRQSDTMVWFGKPKGPVTSTEDVITQHHPMMRFVTQLVANKTGGDFAPAISARIVSSKIKGASFEPGIYIIGIQRWSISGLTDIEKLAYSCKNENKGTHLTSDEAELLATAILTDGEKNLRSFTEEELTDFAITVDHLFEALQLQFDDFYAQHELSLRDRANFQLRSLDRHFKAQENSILDVIEGHRSVMNRTNDPKVMTRRNALIKASEGRLRALSEKVDVRKQKIKKGKDSQSSQKDVSAIILEIV